MLNIVLSNRITPLPPPAEPIAAAPISPDDNRQTDGDGAGVKGAEGPHGERHNSITPQKRWSRPPNAAVFNLRTGRPQVALYLFASPFSDRSESSTKHSARETNPMGRGSSIIAAATEEMEVTREQVVPEFMGWEQSLSGHICETSHF